MPRDLKDALDAHRARQTHARMTNEESVRLRERLDRSVNSSTRMKRRVLGAVSLSVGAAIAVFLLVQKPTPPPYKFVVTHGSHCLQASESEFVMHSPCESTPILKNQHGDMLRLQQGAHVKSEESDEVRVVAGTVDFDFRPRSKRFVVIVSHGRIEIVGTRFVVDQGPDGGSVRVLEGVVRYSERGDVRELRAGQTWVWPQPLDEMAAHVEEMPAEKPASPSREPEKRVKTLARRPPPEPQAPAVADVEALMRRLFQLRSQRRYDDAITLLDRAMKDSAHTRAQQIRFASELGRILEKEKDRSTICAHWRWFIRSFGAADVPASSRRTFEACVAETQISRDSGE